MRVADRIVLNAPDFDVRHYIIGDRPEGAFNEQYTYINSLSEIDAELESAHQIYGS